VAPAFSDFVVITLAAWAVAGVVFLAGRWIRWQIPGRVADIAFYCALAIYTATFAILGVLRHEALNSHSYDMAIYDQVVWNISQGRWFQTSLEYYVHNFLGDHLSLGLTFLAPLYWVFGSPWVLILLQPLAMALAGLPVFWWAKKKLGPGSALSTGLAYLIFTPAIYVIAIDFHDIVLAAPLLSFAAYFMMRGDARRFALFAFPALLVKEEVGLLVSILGLYWLIGRRQHVFGAGTAVLGLAWALVAMTVIIPSFNSDGQYYYLARNTSLGVSQTEFILSFLRAPGEAISHVFTPEKTKYLLHLLTPLGFIPLLGPGLLVLVSPTLGYLLLRAESPQFLLITQYAAPIVPFLFYATIRGMARLGGGRRAAAVSAALLVASIASFYYQSPGPLSRNFVPERYTVSARALMAKEIMAGIPLEAGVVAQTDLVPHLSQRQLVHMFPEVPSYDRVDYVLLDRKGNRYPLAGSDEAYEQVVAEVAADPRFTQSEERDGFVLLKRSDEVPIPLEAVLGGKARLYGYSLHKNTENDRELVLSLYWGALAPMPEDYSLFVHVKGSHEKPLAQWDGPPLGRYLPTSRWKTGVQLRGAYAIAIPVDIAVEDVLLEVGLYDWRTLERLPVLDGSGSPAGNSVVLRL